MTFQSFETTDLVAIFSFEGKKLLVLKVPVIIQASIILPILFQTNY